MRPMADTQRIKTAQELLDMPADEYSYELIHGELRRMSKPGARHGMIAMRLGGWLFDHVEKNDLGLVLAAETGFQLEHDHVRAPDVAFIRKERIDERGIPVRHWPGAPDLAIEVLSPNDTYSYMQEKACDWIGCGARMVLVVDTEKRLVSVYRSRHEVRVLTVDEAIDGGDTVPGWRVEIRELFAE
ncbi:MAG: Uma2 family endonuclease [Planctomycetota bacterium]